MLILWAVDPGGNMKLSVLLLTLISSMYLLNACGGGASSGGGGGNLVATHFSLTAPATATGGSTFSFTVTALDAANNLATGYAGTVTFTSTDGHALLPGTSTLVDGTGTFTATLESAGNQTIAATDLSRSTITGVTNSITVATVAARLAVTVPLPAKIAAYFNFTVTAGTPLSFTVTALDSADNPVPVYTGTVSFTSTDGQAALPANSTLTNGTGTFSATLKTAGNQTIAATDTATVSITGTSISIHVVAPASGFTPTGSMLNARESHTATLLNDGRVLVVGGANITAVKTLGPILGCPSFFFCYVFSPLASAEIYDPTTAAFTSTGAMSATRVFHTTTLLSDGKVLIAGGDDRSATAPTTTFATAEIFDPSTGVFTLTGNMVNARSGHTATLLTNGKVLLAGGNGGNGDFPLAAELFDPATGEFTATGDMTEERVLHTATLLSDGRVLLAGGNSAGASSATAELFDPTTGTFSLAGNMVYARSGHTATLLTDGKVLLAGGDSGNGNLPLAAELFDPTTGTFATTGSTGTVRAGQTATLLANGKVLVTGGIDANKNILSTAEMYDPASGTFTAAGNMEIERLAHAAILLLNGKVLITGGVNADNTQNLMVNSLGLAELFP